MPSPADPNYQVARLVERIAGLERQVGVLMRLLSRADQRATVYSFTSGSAQCVIEFVETGTRVPMPYLFGYTPVPGHGGHVLDLTSGQVFIPASAF